MAAEVAEFSGNTSIHFECASWAQKTSSPEKWSSIIVINVTLRLVKPVPRVKWSWRRNSFCAPDMLYRRYPPVPCLSLAVILNSLPVFSFWTLLGGTGRAALWHFLGLVLAQLLLIPTAHTHSGCWVPVFSHCRGRIPSFKVLVTNLCVTSPAPVRVHDFCQSLLSLDQQSLLWCQRAPAWELSPLASPRQVSPVRAGGVCIAVVFSLFIQYCVFIGSPGHRPPFYPGKSICDTAHISL